LPALLAAAHLLFAIAEIFARVSADIFGFGCQFFLWVPLRTLAHLFSCDARIRAKPSALIFRLFPG